MFVELHRENGRAVTVNTDYIQQLKGDKEGGAVLRFSDGVDFEVTETYQEVQEMLVGGPGVPA